MCLFVQDCFVDEAGCYTEDAGPALQGLPVLSKGSEAVMTLMSDNILHSEQLVHSYPYDWRTKQPVIVRASCQWFIDTNAIKQKAIVSCAASEIFYTFAFKC
jgi:isoleucyl-tRNA synthetase